MQVSQSITFPEYNLQVESFSQNTVAICVKKKFLGAFSVTSRRWLSTSRRLFEPSLSRRDVDFQHRDVVFHNSLSRRNVDFQRRDVDFHNPLERRYVAPQRRDVVNSTLCHVATLPSTSRRRLVQRSVTSRRCPERRDVALF